MGGKGGGSKVQYVNTPTQTSQTNKIEPWAPTAQPLQNLMQEALSQYYSEPSVVGYQAPSTRQEAIYETYGPTTTYSGSPVTEADLYSRWNGSENRWGALPSATRDAIASTLERIVATESGLNFGHTPGLAYMDPATRDKDMRYWSGRPSSGPYADRGAMLRITEDQIQSNPIGVINSLGLNWQDVVSRAGVGQTASTTPGGRRITGYRTVNDPGSPGVFIAPETRMLADFLSNEATNRGYYEQPLQMYGDYLRRGASGGYSLNPDLYMVNADDYALAPGELIGGDWGITDPELMRWNGGINPYARALYNQMSEDIQSNVMGAMNMAGRVGSGANTRILAEEMGDLGTRFYQPIYEAEQQRKFSAEQQNAMAQQAAVQRELQVAAENAAAEQAAINRQLGIEQTNAAKRAEVDAANRAFQQRAAELLPNVHQARRDLTTWISGLLERSGQLRKQIADQPNLERAEALRRAMSMVTPLAGMGGMTTIEGSGNQTTPYFYNPAASAMGGALMGAQLPGMFGMGGGLASGIGAGLGALMLSGRQYKDDIQDIDPNKVMDGFRKMSVKKWRYKPEVGMGTDSHVGPIAQDFNASFGIETPRNDAISMIDAIGVTMAGIKNIDERLRKAGV